MRKNERKPKDTNISYPFLTSISKTAKTNMIFLAVPCLDHFLDENLLLILFSKLTLFIWVHMADQLE